MAVLFRLLMMSLCLGLSIGAFGQTEPADATPEPAKKTQTPAELMGVKTFQIYLNDPVQKVKSVKYNKSGKRIKFQLSDNKDIIYIEDYDYKNSVKVIVVNANGEEEEFSKSRCAIDPVIEM